MKKRHNMVGLVEAVPVSWCDYGSGVCGSYPYSMYICCTMYCTVPGTEDHFQVNYYRYGTEVHTGIYFITWD
jgi:hypothetical protein